MMNLVYRRKGLSSVSRKSEEGPLPGRLEGVPMVEGDQSRPARCCAAASWAAANLDIINHYHYCNDNNATRTRRRINAYIGMLKVS